MKLKKKHKKIKYNWVNKWRNKKMYAKLHNKEAYNKKSNVFPTTSHKLNHCSHHSGNNSIYKDGHLVRPLNTMIM